MKRIVALILLFIAFGIGSLIETFIWQNCIVKREIVSKTNLIGKTKCFRSALQDLKVSIFKLKQILCNVLFIKELKSKFSEFKCNDAFMTIKQNILLKNIYLKNIPDESLIFN